MFEDLKLRQSRAWGGAAFEEIEAIGPEAYDELVRLLAPQPGERWLDVACGTGAIALRAARAGARVTGTDFAEPLLATARRRAAAEGLVVPFELGDAEALPYPAGSFEVVSSSFGVMFAPDHRRAAAELARVIRPGGRLGLNTWDPDSGTGGMFSLTARFQPPLPEGAGSPLDWGRPDYVERLLGKAFELEFHVGDAPLHAESGRQVWELFSRALGPVKELARSLEEPRRSEYERAYIEFYESHRTDDGIHVPRAFLCVVGRRR